VVPVKSAAVLALAVVLLAGCSGNDEPTSTPTTPTTSQSDPSGDGTTEPAADSRCSFTTQDATDDVAVDISDTITEAKDEWATEMGIASRHYYPMTITNTSDESCLFIVTLKVTAGSDSDDDKIVVALDPGQKWLGETFSLDDLTSFDGTTPADPVSVEVSSVTKEIATPTFFDATFEFGDLEVKDTGNLTLADPNKQVLPLTITNDGENAGWPEPGDDQHFYVVVNGLDENGDVVAATGAEVGPYTKGKPFTTDLQAWGDGSTWRHDPAADFTKAVKFVVASYGPSLVKNPEDFDPGSVPS